jgi:hypothetical protein
MAAMTGGRFSQHCESPACPSRKHPWRAWLTPLRGLCLDGHWYCSPECFLRALTSAIEQLLPVTAQPHPAAHRVPLGLLMLSRGHVDNEQLKKALKAQKDSGSGRVGEWLRHIGAATEEQVTQALGSQWSIPVFPLNQTRQYLECAHLIPLPLLEAAEMVPVHHIAISHHLYMAFVDRVNHTALYSVEKMLECRTEPCLASQSQVRHALEELRRVSRPGEIAIDNVSEPREVANTILSCTARLGADHVRISGFSGFIWARLYSPSASSDVLFRVWRDTPEAYIDTAERE